MPKPEGWVERPARPREHRPRRDNDRRAPRRDDRPRRDNDSKSE